ncbi:META domain-containing protein [Microbacterium sp. JZ31]|uniref:META domain-containing protein n=1 Tax=Microbacterium sp. JZ31 TaxID=1906274 RepID=UPI0019316833|nr:META domain-containing protein [Microbacterium sp. JZ31]
MRTRLVALPSLAASALVLLAACAGPDGSAFAGEWGGPAPSAHVAISEDGSFSGSDGCNIVFGTGEFSGDRFEFGDDVARTLMACPDSTVTIDPWPEAARIEGEELILLDDEDAELGRLPRMGDVEED